MLGEDLSGYEAAAKRSSFLWVYHSREVHLLYEKIEDIDDFSTETMYELYRRRSIKC